MRPHALATACLSTCLVMSTVATAAEKTVTANIKSVDAAKNSIHLGDVDLDVTRKTKITVDGKKATLDDIKAGQKAKVTYDDEIEVAISIAATKDGKDDAKPAEDDSDAEVLLEETLDKWIPVKKGEDISNWSVSEGVLTLDATGPSIRTKKTYDDFDLHLEFKLPPKCNTGVFLRGRYELQLLDSQFTPPSGKPLPATDKCGAICGLIAPSKDVYKGPKKWNTLDVRFVGDKVTVKMNDVVIIENKVIKSVTGGALDENESDPGPILLQAHALAGQEFRNITIKPIPIAE